jgi:hypothetical protein
MPSTSPTMNSSTFATTSDGSLQMDGPFLQFMHAVPHFRAPIVAFGPPIDIHLTIHASSGGACVRHERDGMPSMEIEEGMLYAVARGAAAALVAPGRENAFEAGNCSGV